MVVSERLDSLFLRVHACQTHKRKKKKKTTMKKKSLAWGAGCYLSEGQDVTRLLLIALVKIIPALLS